MIESNVAKNLNEHEKARLRGVLKVCQVIEGAAVMLCPVDKGDLRSAIGYACKLGSSAGARKPGNADGIVIANKRHAAPVEFGTRPHVITVKNARVLSDGKTVFGTRVNHPGTQAQPFMRPAWDQNKGNSDRIMKSELGGITK
jgi:HK97 gp10 family phage protein